ncbi:hypothetical protein DKX38_008748 [Salix brachista]|uniref:DUF4283 domain-containing protein n=1 Tax=Salix brachista TaxID=2182728 RepID=A0A5N5M8V9_9ROSI|nr:hypothetical protein DKX38_008748 [Salix brachista]
MAPTAAKKPQNKTEPTTQTTSWADRVKVSDSSTRYTLDPIPQQERGCHLVITEDMFTEQAEQWSRCMVGFFPGYRMNYHAVNKIASRVWRSKGLEDVRTTASGFIIFRFKTEDQMLKIIERGPWLFGGKAIILQQWHPHFIFDKSKISKLPVWVRLHGLPFPLWSRKGLSLVASMVGRPLACDEATFTSSRLDFARVCVELDAKLPFVHHFNITTPLSEDPLHIEVEYEWKPTRCPKCLRFGHACKVEEVPKVAKPNTDVEAVLALTEVEGGQVASQGANPNPPATLDGTSGKKLSHDQKAPPRADDEASRIVVSKGDADLTIMKGNKSHNKHHQVIPVMDPNHPLDAGTLGSTKGNGKDPVASSWNPKEPITLLKRTGDCSEDEEMRASEYSTGEVSGTKEVRHICTVNMMASLQSQSVEKDSDDNVVDSSQLECNLDNRDTSPSSFTKVKKKKGGKKKNKEAHRL